MWQNQIIFSYKYPQKMSLEKVLHKIQSQINDLAPTLELIVDETIQPSVDNCEKIINRLSLMMLRMYNCLKKEYKETIKNLSLLECHYRADLYNFFTIRSHISDSLRTYLNDTIYPGLLNKLEILYPQRNLYYVFPMKKTDY